MNFMTFLDSLQRTAKRVQVSERREERALPEQRRKNTWGNNLNVQKLKLILVK